jgi:hypothetical protein
MAMNIRRFSLTAVVGLLICVAMTLTKAAALGKEFRPDLEERVAALEAIMACKGCVVSFQLSGQVNKMLFLWDAASPSDAFVFESSFVSSSAGLKGKTIRASGVAASFLFEFNISDAWFPVTETGWMDYDYTRENVGEIGDALLLRGIKLFIDSHCCPAILRGA